MKFHPLADIFPLMPDEELRRLATDIKANGLNQPITVLDQQILDGRNRFKACELVRIKPAFKQWGGEGNARDWVISQNLHRRHLNESQRAMIAAKLANMPHGGDRKSKDQKLNLAIDQSAAAKLLHVSVASLKNAKTVLHDAAKADIEAVEAGEKTIHEVKRTMKRAAQTRRIRELQGKPKSQDIKGPFDLILADPPWKYEHCEADNREIENHYPTASLDEILKHSPDSAAQSILFLWATAPKLGEALRVMAAWGFDYRSCAVWDKERIGMGYWWRIQHELLLVGVRGSPGCTPECERVSSIFRSPRGRHSAKPTFVYEWIERAFPALKKLEMYCRSPRPGWAVSGNEV